MNEYLVTPHKKGLPSGHHLLEELHRRGLPATLDLKGTDTKWEAILFSEPGPPPMECFLEHSPSQGNFKISLPKDTPQEAEEMKIALADILLRELGGHVQDTSSNERLDLAGFLEKTKTHTAAHMTKSSSSSKSPSSKTKLGTTDVLWILFAWALAAAGLEVYLAMPQYQHPITLGVAGLALLSALGLTFSRNPQK